MNLSQSEIKLSDEVKRKLVLPVVKFDLACGYNLHEPDDKDWIHADFDYHDKLDFACSWNEIPLPTESVDILHFSDAIEHIRTWESDISMKEINRVIKMGGKLIGTTPNRSYIIKCAYEKTKDEEWIMRNLYGDGNGYGHTHYQTFTKESLTQFLNKYGFCDAIFNSAWGDNPDNFEWLSFTAVKTKNI